MFRFYLYSVVRIADMLLQMTVQGKEFYRAN
jgi:hypothetical protein